MSIKQKVQYLCVFCYNIFYLHFVLHKCIRILMDIRPFRTFRPSLVYFLSIKYMKYCYDECVWFVLFVFAFLILCLMKYLFPMLYIIHYTGRANKSAPCRKNNEKIKVFPTNSVSKIYWHWLVLLVFHQMRFIPSNLTT